MAVARRGYVFGAFFIGLVSVLLIIVSVSSNDWISATATETVQVSDSVIQYGLFRGYLQLNTFATPSENVLYMVCVADEGVCAVTCKTDSQAREDEVRALAQGLRPNPACTSFNNIESGDDLETPPVISYAFYICLVLLLFLQLVLAVVSTGLALLNACKNPTEPIFGLPGCLWCNCLTAVIGVAAMLTFGVYYTTSGLKSHLAMGYIALGLFEPSPGLGYSYWMLLGAIVCSLCNVALIVLRRHLLERVPPPPTIKVENHSDGTIFLY